jgi:hypothetical protein
VGFKVLNVVDFNLVDSVLHITPKSNGVKSGDLGGQSNRLTSAYPSPSNLSVQVIPNMVAEIWRRTIFSENSLRW